MDMENDLTSPVISELPSNDDAVNIVIIDSAQYEALINYPEPIDYTPYFDKLNNGIVACCNLIVLLFLFGIGKVVYNTLYKTF